MSKAAEFLKPNSGKAVKGAKAAETPAAAASSAKPEQPPGRKMRLADGTEIFLEDLRPEERQGATFRSDFFWRHSRLKPRNLPSVFVVPDFLRPPKDPDEKLSERQKDYKARVVTTADLTEKTPKTVKSGNRQHMSRYVFIAELKANKNGLLYYLIPTVINAVFLAFNIAEYNFVANILLSIIVICDILAAFKIFRTVKNVLLLSLSLVLLIGINVGLYFLGTLVPGLYESVYLPYAIKLFFICLGLYWFAGYYVNFLKVYHDDLRADVGNIVKVYSGPPRVGKTSLAVQEAFIMAKMKWRDLQFDFWSWTSREKEILKRNDPDELLLYEEIKLSYNFYIMRRCIPCLWSNIPIFDKKGRASHKVTLKHMRGLDRLPLYSVVVFDEIGASLKADYGLNRAGTDKPVDVSDMFRLGGQWLKWCVFCSEQDYNHIYIDVRRVVGQNIMITGREWKNRPYILYSIYKTFKFFITDTLDGSIKRSPGKAKFMLKFKNFVESIGYAVTKYGYRGNTQTGGETVEKDADGNIYTLGRIRSRWALNRGVCNYDHEAFKQLYPAFFDKEIRGEVHQSRAIDGRRAESYEFVNDTALLAEKREAQREKIGKIA